MNATELRREIIRLVRAYYDASFGSNPFDPEDPKVGVSGRVFDADEICSLVEASLDFWLTAGPITAEFERRFASWMGVRGCSVVNSGSSANLLAVSALTSSHLGNRRLQPGDEVITCATGFPTTVNPILQNGLIPVFVDASLPTYNVDVDALEAAISPRTRAILLAHTLGNPFDVGRVAALAKASDLWLVEDTCDAVGAEFGGRRVGGFGAFATVSFYPAHHITMGEGGAVLSRTPKLRKIVESFRDWGRDCWCAPGDQNTCGKRFEWQLGDLPYGFDHKYIYSHIGYNLKATDLQAAIGLAQLDKLDRFVLARRENFEYLYDGLRDLEGDLILPEPTPASKPSWFGFPVTVRSGGAAERNSLVQHLEGRGISTRFLFGGNITRQPAYRNSAIRISGDLKTADRVMNSSFWFGVYPALSRSHLDYVVATLHAYFR